MKGLCSRSPTTTWPTAAWPSRAATCARRRTPCSTSISSAADRSTTGNATPSDEVAQGTSLARVSRQMTGPTMRARAALMWTMLLNATMVACSIGDEQEKAIGQDASAQIERELPIVTDPEITAYVTSFGTSLASKSDDRNREWRFRVVDDEQ